MRIIGGKFNGRRINPPLKNWPTRPTMDFSKEALFNLLEHRYDLSNKRVLELFGGTGSISLEFISRGAQAVHYVEKYAPCISFLKKTKKELEIGEELTILKNEVYRYIRDFEGDAFDIIFSDPPYDYRYYTEIADLVFIKNLIKDDGLLIMEHDLNVDLKDHEYFQFSRKYGGSYFSFLSRNKVI